MKDLPILYLKVRFYDKFVLYLLLILTCMIGACASSGPNSGQKFSEFPRYIENSLALSQQKAPPNDIRSIQLHPEGQPGRAPIIKLNSSQKLQLSFDYLGTQNRQFRVTVTHHNKKWERSAIVPNTYLESFSETTITTSEISFGQHLSYHHVAFSFPNNELQPAVSGNYLIKIYNTNNGGLLFSMPFFITEDEGTITTKVQRLFAKRSNGRPLHQLFSTYYYPDWVEHPQFDLSMAFVQNQFWGRTKVVKSLDTITPGQLHGYIERKDAFIGNYEFKFLDLRNFSADGRQIIAYQPEITPPRIILRRDIQNLDMNVNLPAIAPGQGMIDNHRNSNYAQVVFRLDTGDQIPQTSEIYIVGHFNNWIIDDLNRMNYDPDEQLWKGRALIKQGQYAYKYVMIKNNRLDDLSLDQGYLSADQEYLTFIYFKDPNRHFDRLLKVDRIIQK